MLGRRPAQWGRRPEVYGRLSPVAGRVARVTTTLLLIRHGQSTWNAEGRWQGQADPPLSDLGRWQAAEASAKLGELDVIVSSPQQRALETAAILSGALGVGPVHVVDDLRERSAGPWSGLTRAEIEHTWPGWVDAGNRPDGYELDGPLVARVRAVLDEVVAAFSGATALVVCHGGVIRALEADLGIAEGRIPNLAGRVLHHGPGGLRAGERLELAPHGPVDESDPRV
jgi:broad specificity phosphatase PhoE